MKTYIIESLGPNTPQGRAMAAAQKRLGQSPWIEVFRTTNGAAANGELETLQRKMGTDRVRMRVRVR